jgi:predicted ferric reductase
MKKLIGVTIIILSLLITLALWLPLKAPTNFVDLVSNLRFMGQLTALLGIVLFCIEFVLATRAKLLESIFGGLDKLYLVHHLVGGIAFILLMNHPLLLAINVLPSIDGALMYLWLGPNLAYNLGVIAVYSLMILIALTFYFKLPYNIWKNLHEWMGLPILFATLHVVLINSDTSQNSLLRFWILIWCAIAIISFIYKRFLYKYLGTNAAYSVERVVKKQEIVEIYLRPKKKALNFKPGQFAFLSFEKAAIGGEPHPYSMSSVPGSELLRFSIKALGDYTLKLRELAAGTKALVYGPFGRFFDKAFIKNNDEIWIAGGIGITPFLSMLHERVTHPVSKNISLYYCSKTLDEAAYDNEIREAIINTPNIHYVNFCAAVSGRISADIIAAQHNNQVKDKLIFICGPKPMMESLNQQFLKLGVKQNNIIFEDFSFKA